VWILFDATGLGVSPRTMSINRNEKTWAWWFTSVISAFKRLRQESYEFEASLGYMMRPYLKKKKIKEK
jgi:hypothetical protein